MMEKLKQRIDEQTRDLVDEMLDAIEAKLVALIGSHAVERDGDTIHARSHVLDSKRRLNDPRLRFLLESFR